jgi:hypothetical protein
MMGTECGTSSSDAQGNHPTSHTISVDATSKETPYGQNVFSEQA